MKRFMLVLVLIFIISIPLQANATRYLWSWSNTSITNNLGTARATFYSFCTAPFGNPANAVNYVYYYAHTDISSNTTNLRNFIADAHSKGLKVIFLDGDPNWVTSATNRLLGETVMDNVLNFNKAGSTTQRFDGVQFDVEPYLATGWSKKKAAFWSQFTTLLGNCQKKVNTYNASYTPIYFEEAIPRWYDTDGDAVTSNTQVQNLTNSVAIMDYVDTVSSITTDALGEIIYADSIGKKVVVGVETMNIAPLTSTFYDEGNAIMETRLGQATPVFATHSSFWGIAIHDYANYRILNSGAKLLVWNTLYK